MVLLSGRRVWHAKLFFSYYIEVLFSSAKPIWSLIIPWCLHRLGALRKKWNDENEWVWTSLSGYPMCLTGCVFPWEVMQCSAAMDILFLMDGSYSVGKGSFERSKHYAVKLCQALDIGPDKVCLLSDLCLCPPLPLMSITPYVTPPSSRCESAWFSSVPLLGWSSPWTRTPPNKSWTSTWRRFLTGSFLLSTYSPTNHVFWSAKDFIDIYRLYRLV